jgi:ABC-type oligopeptide transport system ATPase subunit
MVKVRKQTAKRKRANKKSKSAVERIEPIQFDEDEGIKINLYGSSGTGKTTLWATFPKPILAIICSGHSKTGELRSINTKEYRKTIKSVVINSSNDIQELVDYQKESGEFATVVLEHATGLQDYILKEILELAELPVQLSWGIATQQQYGQVGIQMKERMRSLLDLPCTTVIVAQEREFNTEVEGDIITPFVASALTPSVMTWLNSACDYICQTYLKQKTEIKVTTIGKKKIKTKKKVDGVDYCLRTAPHSIFKTKFRLPKGVKLPPDITDPSYEKIMDLIQGR